MANSPNVISESQLLNARMAAQLLGNHSLATPQALVKKMGAIQAQHFDMTQWAVGKRLSLGEANPAITIDGVQQALKKGEIVRTHALRPTWQLLAGEDLLWILQLTAPAIKRVIFSRDKHLGILEKEYVKSDQAIYRILEKGPALNRQELIGALTENGFTMDEYRSNHYIMHAELQGIICSGPVKGGKHSYALTENVLGKNYKKAEKLKGIYQQDIAVMELAGRYFGTRGPATLQDFGWWSGLGMTAIKKAIVNLGDQVEIFKHENDSGTTYYQKINAAALKEGSGAANELPSDSGFHLLPAFDEYLISYKDRTHSLPAAFNRQIITVNGLFKPAMVTGGRVTGGWQVDRGKKGLKITLLPFVSLKSTEQKKLLSRAESAAISYCAFRQMPLEAMVIG